MSGPAAMQVSVGGGAFVGSGKYERPVGLVADLDTSVTPHTLTFPQSGEIWTFDATTDQLTSIDDGNGNTITITYQTSDPDRVDTVTHSDGNQLTYTWYGDHLLDTITDNSTLSRETVYGYPNGGNGVWKLTSYTDREGNTTGYGHDGDNRITRITDAEGNITRIGYDTDGRVTGIDRDSGGSFVADWTFVYGQIPSGPAETDVIEGNDPGSADDDRAATWKTTMTDPNSNTTRFLSTRRGEVLRVIDGENNLQDGQFSPRGFRVSQYAPDSAASGGAATQYEYSQLDSPDDTTMADSLSSLTTEAGNTTSFSYDAATYANAPYDPVSSTTTNSDGDTLSLTTAEFDTAVNAGPGRPSKTTITTEDDGTGSPVTYDIDFEYNTAGQLTKVTKPEFGAEANPVTTYDYTIDSDPWLDKITTPGTILGDVTYTHDTMGRLASVTDGNGDTTDYQYDSEDRITKIDYDDGSYQTDTYDDVGNLLTRKVFPPGSGATPATITYTYDGFNRIATETMPGRTTTTYTYDDVGNVTSMAGDATTTYTYNGRNLVDTVSTATGTADDITFTYTDAGQRSQISYPGGLDVDTNFDDVGRTDTIIAQRGSTTYIDLGLAYDTDLDGDLADDTGQLQRVWVNHDDAVWDYTYDLASQLTSAVRTDDWSGYGTLGYDQDYTYDGRGNLRTIDDAIDSNNDRQYFIGLGDQITYISPYVGTPSYDGRGQLTGNGQGLTLGYNNRGQTTTIGAGSLEYAGPGQTNRLEGDGGTEFTPTARNTVLQTDDGAVTNHYIYDPSGLLLGIDDGTDVWYPITDQQGSILALVDDSGVVGTEYTYSPFGDTLTTTGTDRSGYRWLGTLGYHTDNTGLIQVGARYYHPDIQRWTQPDPSALETNAYNYAGNDPVNNSDPSGLHDDRSIVGCYGGLAAGASSVGGTIAAAGTAGFSFGPVGAVTGIVGASLLALTCGTALQSAQD